MDNANIEPGHKGEFVCIYEAVQATGLPNCMGARIKSGLNLGAWESYADGNTGEMQLIEFLTYGFPVGYLCPTSDTSDIPNNSSTINFPGQVQAFMDTEV